MNNRQRVWKIGMHQLEKEDKISVDEGREREEKRREANRILQETGTVDNEHLVPARMK